MINVNQLRELITKVLREINDQIPFSPAAVEILLMIAAHESKLGTYLRQRQGPALGLFQIEPATERDIYANYLSYRQERRDLLLSYKTKSNINDMEFNLAYQIVIARINLLRKPGALPNDPETMARYLKKYWNTIKGTATALDYLEAYKKLINKGGGYLESVP